MDFFRIQREVLKEDGELRIHDVILLPLLK